MSLSHVSTITVEGITTIQTRENGINHWVLYSLLIVVIALEPFSSTPMSILGAIRHFVRTLFIACTPPAGSSTEHVFYTYSLPQKLKTKTAAAKVGDITQNIDLGYACFQEKYYRVCIDKAAVAK